jgi:hypothetical protein
MSGRGQARRRRFDGSPETEIRESLPSAVCSSNALPTQPRELALGKAWDQALNTTMLRERPLRRGVPARVYGFGATFQDKRLCEAHSEVTVSGASARPG